MAVKLGILTWKYRDRCFWSEPQAATTGTAVFGPDILASFFCAGSFCLATEPPCCKVKLQKKGASEMMDEYTLCRKDVY